MGPSCRKRADEKTPTIARFSGGSVATLAGFWGGISGSQVGAGVNAAPERAARSLEAEKCPGTFITYLDSQMAIVGPGLFSRYVFSISEFAPYFTEHDVDMPALKCRFAVHLGLESLSFVKIVRDAEHWRAVAYGDIPWQGMERSHEEHHEHLESLIRRLGHQQGLTRESVHVSLHSRYCVSRVVTGSKQDFDAQFDEIATNSQHYLQFGLGEKLIGRSHISLGDGDLYGQVAIIKRGLCESIDKALQRCGLKIHSIDGAMPNICRLIGLSELDQAPLLIVWLTESTAEIGISYRGRLQLSYQLGGNTSPDAVAETIRKHLKRLRRFCDRYRVVNENAQLNRLVIMASHEHTHELRQHLEGSAFEQVYALDDVTGDQLSNHIVLGEQRPSAGVVTALGGLLGQVEPDILPFTDVLEQYNSCKPRTLKSIFVIDALPVYAAASLALVLCGWSGWMAHKIDESVQQTRVLEISLAAEREQMLKLDEVRTQCNDIEELQCSIERLGEGELTRVIAQCLPPDTRIESFAIDLTGKLILKGTMMHGDRSFELLQTLRRSPAIEEVALESVGKASTFGVATTMFEINCQLSKHLPNCGNSETSTAVPNEPSPRSGT